MHEPTLYEVPKVVLLTEAGIKWWLLGAQRRGTWEVVQLV